MKFEDIATLRIKSQHTAAADFRTAGDVVSWMGAMQAQDYAGALWSIGLRTPHLTQADIEQAIIRKEIVRTWPMRGTLHFVSAKDARWMVKLLAPRAIAAAASRRHQLEITDAVIAKAQEIITAALSSGKEKSRTELLQLLDEGGIATANQRGIHLLRYFAEQGILCFGPHAGKQPTFVLLDLWLPPVRELTRDESLTELAKRYFLSHGPATMKDFTGWANLVIADAKLGIKLAGDQLSETTINGTTYWFDPTLDFSPDAPTAHLLPGFDEFMLGYKDRLPSLAAEHTYKIVPGGNGMFLPTIVVDGKVIGTWKRRVRTRDSELRLTPFASFSDITILESARVRYEQFTGTPVKISL